jgi:hypothetical protein
MMTANATSKTRLLTQKAAWKALGEHYQNVRNVHLQSLLADDPHRGERMAVEGAGDPGPHEVCAGEPVRQEMKSVGQLAGASGRTVHRVAVSATRSATDYTARVIPHCDGVAVPLEEAHILWQR